MPSANGDAREDVVIQAAFTDTEACQNVKVLTTTPDPTLVGARNKVYENAASNIQGPTGQVISSADDIQIFAGLRDGMTE